MYPKPIAVNDRKNCHKLVGFKMARLLAKTQTIPKATATQPKGLTGEGKNTRAKTPMQREITDKSAAMPRHQG